MISSSAMRFLTHIDQYINWDTVMMVDRINDLVGLIFWDYAIYILQINDDVKKIFFPESKKEDSQIIQNWSHWTCANISIKKSDRFL